MKNIFIAIFILLSTVAMAQNNFGINSEKGIPKGLEIGEKAPNFKAKNSNGKIIELKNELKKGSVVILFYRGKWCPVCSQYLSEIEDSLKYINEKGARVLAIGPEKIENAKEAKSKFRANFTFIADESEEIMKNYDVLFSVTENYQKMIEEHLGASIKENNGKTEAHLPVPATYVINKEGVIVYKQFDINYKNRATVAAVLKYL